MMASVRCSLLLGLLCAACGAQLHFRSDRTFKIVQFTDLHYGSIGADALSMEVEETVLATEKPDFVALTGDVVSGAQFNHVDMETDAYKQMAVALQANNVKWGMTFGNHDDQGPMTRQQLMAVDQSLDGSMSQYGPSNLQGVSNYWLPIYAGENNTELKVVLYFLAVTDSGKCANSTGDGCITPDQVQWYTDTAKQFMSENGGTPVYSLMFFHIPLPQYMDLWNSELCYGSKNEDICCPSVETGLYDAMLQMGDVRGVFVGHDHTNDYCGSFASAPQLMLCYGRKTGFGYYNPGPFEMHHGGRVIELSYDDSGSVAFATWIRNDLGLREELPVHLPTGPGQLVCA